MGADRQTDRQTDDRQMTVTDSRQTVAYAGSIGTWQQMVEWDGQHFPKPAHIMIQRRGSVYCLVLTRLFSFTAGRQANISR